MHKPAQTYQYRVMKKSTTALWWWQNHIHATDQNRRLRQWLYRRMILMMQ